MVGIPLNSLTKLRTKLGGFTCHVISISPYCVFFSISKKFSQGKDVSEAVGSRGGN